ncbi:substrate-binding domain-containing protein [Variovorax sp. dw_308]|uniref:substrate-binding domain-containing protein n=1 Tax=Variovorax sp. dw_308 TaxID=2721546 RepID=UPI001C448216|nr:substrate-binding domain-containing protein [Variovorax sp. dw_308]
MNSATIHIISSMATRQVLGELADAWQRRTHDSVRVESVGGVDAAKRVQIGEAFDIAVLASDAIGKLVAAGKLVAGSEVALAHSGVAVAVRAGVPAPDITSEAALRNAVLASPNIGYSTGPSGVALIALFERWGIAEALQQRLVQAPAGVPVGTLIANGAVALGFQQLGELMRLDGIDIVGPLPDAIQITTTFSAAMVTGSTQVDAVRQLLAFMISADAAATKRRHGMEPA